MTHPSGPTWSLRDDDSPDTAPEWFVDAISAPFESAEVEVDGKTVRAQCWGPVGPGLVLIHGGGAHAGWWDHIAPLLASEHRVVAVDLSGHGDSDWRADYSMSGWAAEALASARAGGVEGPPLVVGHSMGGWVALTIGAEFSADVAGVVVIDSPIVRLVAESATQERRAAGVPRRYATADEAIAHFRTIPDDPYIQPFAAAHVAATSVVRRDGAWTWKCDPRVFEFPQPVPDLLAMVRCRVTVFRAEHGLVTTKIGARMYDLLGRAAPVILLPNTGHHVMLDEPLALVVALRTVLAEWRHSRPVMEVHGRLSR